MSQPEPEPPKPTPCPHCGKDIGLEMVARLKSQSRMSFTFHPHPGELMSARTIGGSLENLEKLLVAVGRELGVKTQVLVEGVSSIDGSITIDLLLARHEPGIAKRPTQ